MPRPLGRATTSMKTIKRKPIVHDVANQIRSAILDGGLVPGSKIAQDELAAELGVSRLPVRQALLVLQREGLVFLDHGRGALVAPLDIKFVSDLFDCRAAIDGYVAGVLAARENFDPSVLIQIVQEGREAAQRGESRRDLVKEFHMTQYEAVGNQVLTTIMRPLLDHVQRVVTFVQLSTSKGSGDQSKPRAGRSQPGLRSQMDTWDEHAALVEAITDGRVGRARSLARAHVERVKSVAIPFLVSAAPPSRRKTGPAERRRVRETARSASPELSVSFDSLRGK
jgi:DNA-binding GntR family transcriptional regulator